ncbi:TetR/AcrR family transcriptional regulator [Desulforamulus ruminis]|uniref:Regulatory protein TetR n=1 Tax=Desulforamulus ruminis (strain ATCC 23193 / DSM 2154 / NCIMB 8452 / DL) TaxID=696281 RepID=F6DKN2_DESRL|nr:TetR/AcrR family transcriptional regulator [Desulforamulus ruminis]AEG60407.1 regulatory protein TetR [Desulforamulus ruminis DSM 2154]
MSSDNRTSARARILTAASDIIRNQGLERLTLEAVAKEAGLSKGGLLYHFPSKEALITGMVEELNSNYAADIQERVTNDSRAKGKWSRAYVESTFSGLEDGFPMSSALSAVLFTNPKLLEEMQTQYGIWQRNIENDGINPVRASIARLTADGLWFSEVFGLSPLDQKLRERVFHELMNWLKGEDE